MSLKHNAVLTVLLVRPEKFDKETDDYVSVTTDEAEHARMWDFYKRFRKVLQAVGGVTTDRSGLVVHNVEGFNWEGQASCETYFLTSEAVAKLEGQLEERNQLRAPALAKLTPEEQDALGVFDLKREYIWLT